MGRNSEVGIRLTATDRATGTIEQVRKSLGGLDGAAGLATKGMAGLAGAFGAGMVLQFGQQIVGAGVEMARMAGQAEQVAGSMQGLAASFGQSGDAMLEALKRASNGTIAEYDLMLGANKAMMLGVATNADQLEGIMKVALSRGAAMGLSTTQAFDNLVTGLGRGSALILDNLGITMQSLRAAEETYAASLGKTTEALSDQEKKQAMVNAVLKEAESVDLSNVDGMAASFAQAQAAVADMKVALSTLFGPAVEVVADAIATAATNAKTLSENLRGGELGAATRESEQAMRALNDAILLQEGLQAEAAGARAAMPALLQQELQLQQAIAEQEKAAAEARRQKDVAYNAGATAGAVAFLEQEATRQEEALASLKDELFGVQLVLFQFRQGFEEVGAAMLGPRTEMETLASILPPVAGAWGQLVTQIGATSAAAGLGASALAALVTPLQGIGIGTSTASGALAALSGDLQSSASAADLWGQYVNTAGKSSDGLRTAAGAASVEVQKLGSAAGGAVAGLAAINAEAINAANALYQLEHAAGQAAAAATASALSSIKASALQAAGTLGVAEAMQTYEDQARTLQQVGGYLARSGLDQTEVEFQLAAMTQEMTGATMDRVRAIEAEATALTTAAGASGGGGARGYASALGEATVAGQNFSTTLSGLQSSVQSALSGALNVDVGVDPAAFLPREDAVNENARRLADIMVNGFKDQSWLDEFKAEAPDIYGALREAQDPQTAAAGMLQQFQDGLLPGLIDKEAVKEKVKRAILGDANMSALAQEITAELAAEMGQNPAQVAGMVNQAMGRTAGDTKDGDVQTAVVSQLKSQTFMNAVMAAAGNAGAKWGDGFLTQVAGNVPPALVDLLVSLVAPRVREQNDKDKQREGAN